MTLRFQLLLFYPGDWAKESQLLLSEFSKVKDSLVSSDCLVYGVSSDSVHSHQEWLADTSFSPAFPLISDPAALLAYKYGIYSAEEEGEEQEQEKVVELPPCRCIVITDNQSVMLELVSSSFSVEELVAYTQERLAMLLQKRRMAVDRARNRERQEVVDHSRLHIQRKLGEFRTYI